jgi:hypothetical protein
VKIQILSAILRMMLSYILAATYNKELGNIIEKWENKECPQDVKDVILF